MIVRDDDPDCIVEGVANRLSPSIATVAIKNILTATAINSKLLSIKKENDVVCSFLDGMLSASSSSSSLSFSGGKNDKKRWVIILCWS